ncbi:hypothetical protein HVL34_000142 [Escherichia coli]|nr:hypothetical protein [Escherichia coli]
MSIDYLDVRKVIKCAEHKKALDEKAIKLKKNVIDSCKESSLTSNTLIFNQDAENRLTLELSTYGLELVFNEKLVVINEAPLLKFVATDSTDENNKEVISFFLGKNGLVYIGECKPNPSYDYEDVDLFLDILEATLKALKSSDKISY